MKIGRALLATFPLALLPLGACSTPGSALSPPDEDGGADAAPPLPFFMPSASVFVDGHDYDDLTRDCRTEMCRHNENTDMIAWNGSLWLVHRTAISQSLGPNSALHVYRSTDRGVSFRQTALLPAPIDRDIRDPCFFIVGGKLYLKALTRVTPPISASSRDTDVDTVTVLMTSSDGVTWSDQQEIGPHGWSFWRVKEHQGTYYSAAYQDGDLSVVLYSSLDGVVWTAGPVVFGVSADTPLETELTFMPGGKLMALVRTDGTDAELLGDEGALETRVCWADPPYASFSCTEQFDGQRLDGPLTFLAGPPLRRRAQAPAGHRQEADEPLRDPRGLRRRRALHRRVGRAAERGRHVVRGRRDDGPDARSAQLVLGRPSGGPPLGARHLRPHEHLARDGGPVQAAVTGGMHPPRLT